MRHYESHNKRDIFIINSNLKYLSFASETFMMELTSSKIGTRKSLVDESFDAGAAKNYRLYIQLGNDFLAACILDDLRKKFICLEDFRFSYSDNPQLLAEKFELVKQQSKLLSTEDFRSVNCCSAFHGSVLIPEPLFDKRSEKPFMNFNFSDSREDMILTDDLKLIHAKNLFTFPELLQKMLHYWFHDISIHHHSTAFLNSIIISNKNKEEKTVTINLRPADFDLAAMEGSKLIFYNCFQYKTGEDFLYFILFTLEQLQLNPATADIKLAGDIDKQSAFYESACKHLQNVSFCERLPVFKYSYKFEELPPAAYYTLFNQHLCES